MSPRALQFRQHYNTFNDGDNNESSLNHLKLHNFILKVKL